MHPFPAFAWQVMGIVVADEHPQRVKRPDLQQRSDKCVGIALDAAISSETFRKQQIDGGEMTHQRSGSPLDKGCMGCCLIWRRRQSSNQNLAAIQAAAIEDVTSAKEPPGWIRARAGSRALR